MNDDFPMDPVENPAISAHLPVSGEVGVGQVPYHDATTTDTDDSTENAPSVADVIS
jgi:hypothetical protein